MPEFGGTGYMPEGGEVEETFAERVRREQEEGQARLEGVPRVRFAFRPSVSSCTS